MKRTIGILLGLALIAGAGFAHAGRGGGGHGGGGHGGNGGGGSHAGGHPSTGGQHFTTGAMHFTGAHVGVRPGIRPGPVIVGRPGFPHHRVIVGGAVIVAAPYFWYPAYPYPYYPYPYVSPAYGSEPYVQPPTYIEQGGGVAYYCPDYRDYYPNVQSCPSPWMHVIPGTGAPATN